jgi:hypothetical protein
LKKSVFLSVIVLFFFIISSQALWAQRIYRDTPRSVDDPYLLDLTTEQMEKIDKLELEHERKLAPLFNKLRTSYLELDELEMQRNPDQKAIDKKWDSILKMEADIEAREAAHEDQIRKILTPEQRALLDSESYFPGEPPYLENRAGLAYNGRGAMGYGRGLGRGYSGYGRGLGRAYGGYGRGLGRAYDGYGRGLGRAYSGYGRSTGRAYTGTGRGYTGYLGNRSTLGYRGYGVLRLGRGPCGAGLGRYYRWAPRRGGRY